MKYLTRNRMNYISRIIKKYLPRNMMNYLGIL